MDFAWSSKDTKEIRREKEILADRGYIREEVAAFVKKYFEPEKYRDILSDKKPVYLVMPSTRGDNTIPLGIAELLQMTYGGEIIKGFAGAMHETKSANLGAIGKLKEPRIYEIYDDQITGEMVRDKDVFVVDDVVTTGTSVDALRKSLERDGIIVSGVLVLGQSEKRLANERDLKRVYEKVSEDFPDDKELEADISLVFRGSLKHRLNTLEREITGENKWKKRSRGVFYAFIKSEAGRIRREIEDPQRVQPGQENETGFLNRGTKRDSPVPGLAAREQDNLREGNGSSLREPPDKNKTPQESYIQTALRELVIYASGKNVAVPEKTKTRWETLLRQGDDSINIRNYIDRYSSHNRTHSKSPELNGGKERFTREIDL